MDLWIRSQDKMKLIKVNFVFLNYNNSCQIIANYIPDFIGREGDYFETLGTYKSKERALEVLDEIQELLEDNVAMYDDEGYPTLLENIMIYEMPEE